MLDRAGIPSLGPYTVLSRPGEGPVEQIEVSSQMWAHLGARTADAAEARVKEVLANGAWSVQPAEPFYG
jgi:hypothetical protein